MIKTNKNYFHRIIFYWLIILLLITGYFALQNSSWQDSEHLHTLLEVIASLLAFAIGFMTLIRFYSRKESTFLIIGAGYIGIGFLDSYHALITSSWFKPYLLSQFSSLDFWSAIYPRLFLSVILCCSYLIWNREYQLGRLVIIKNKTLVYLIIIVTFISILLTLLPIPQFLFSNFIIHRPEEILPALFFGIALIGYLKKGYWREDSFEYWLVLAIIINFLAEILFIFFSGEKLDNAGILKKLSYIVVLIGLFVSMYESFRQLEQKLAQERINSKQALQESEHYQKAIVDNVVDGLITINQQGIILSFNKAAETIFQYQAEETIGKNISFLMPAPYSKEHDSYLAAYHKTGEGKVIGLNREVEGLTKDGIIFPMELKVSKLQINSQINYLGLVRNISDRRQKENELKHAKQIAESANQAKSEFLSNMSHEIRTPLNGVIGMIELALGTQLDSRQQRFLTTANQSAELLLNVINDILDFSKIEAKKLDLDPHVFILRNSIETTATVIAIRAHEKNIELICSIAHNLPQKVIGDSSRIQQIILNLIGNSVKFTQSGEILVKVELCEDIKSQLDENSSLFHFSVQDTGIGIKKLQQEKIFEAFNQSDISIARHYGGTGLGLSISYQLVKLMGGKMWLESKLGKGSIFHFTIVLGTVTEEMVTAPKKLTSNKINDVLVVDDNATNGLVLKEMLLNWKMKPIVVESVTAALKVLEQAQERGLTFQLIITDYQMPELTGLELVKQVHDNPYWKDTFIIILSSVTAIADIESNGFNNLIDGFLVKPVQQSQLLGKIESLAGKSAQFTGNLEKESNLQLNPRMRILLAEDNLTNQEVVRGLLAQHEINNLTIVDNGKQAIEAYQHQQFDVILMDIRMPEMDGLEATVAIRKLEQHQKSKPIPIVALTAQAMKEDIDIYLAKGMDYYTAKPIKFKELFKILITILPVTTEDIENNQEDTNDIFNLKNSLELLGDNQDLLHKVIKIYLDNHQKLITKVRTEVNLGDAQSISDIGHLIKGSSATFGAKKVVALATKLEKIGKSGETQKAISIATQLEIEMKRLVTVLQNFQDSQSKN